MLLKPIYMRRPPADYQLNTADTDVDDDVTILQPSAKLLRTESPLEHKTCDILAAERLRLMRFDHRLIIDPFQKAICIL